MPKIEQSVTINAPIDQVYRIAKKVEDFPQFMADLQSLNVLERSNDGLTTTTEWVGLIREFRMSVKWVQQDRWDDSAHRDDFVMLRGDMDRMEGYWKFSSPEAESTQFDSMVDYEYNVPLIGPMVKSLIKKKMTDNLQATMDAIKRKSEGAVP